MSAGPVATAAAPRRARTLADAQALHGDAVIATAAAPRRARAPEASR